MKLRGGDVHLYFSWKFNNILIKLCTHRVVFTKIKRHDTKDYTY